ncbi:hypothetical protein BY458DRAFT_174439 [Sporodiniella umbellata]|nr:hypothetical protein BY458DRAFT_174439 [Sporodiniella umbellata]
MAYLHPKKLNDELLCILCQQIMKEVFSTSCGHSFCYECLNKHILSSDDCPSCHAIISKTEIYPNFQCKKIRTSPG